MTESKVFESGVSSQQKPLIEIDATKCVACGQCVAICPARSILKQEGKTPPKFAENGRCIRCGHCVAICPTGAASHIEMPSENFMPLDAALAPEMVEMFLRGKRSARYFTDKPVLRETIEKLLEIAVQAPSDGNQQDRSFVVLTDRKLIDAYEASVIGYYRAFLEQHLASGGDPNFWKILYIRPLLAKYDAGEHPIFRNAPCVICAYARKENVFGWYNCATAMDYLMLMAQSMGLGSCILGFAFNPPEIGHKLLGLSEEQQLYAVITLGYSKHKFRRSVQRRPPEIIWNAGLPA